MSPTIEQRAALSDAAALILAHATEDNSAARDMIVATLDKPAELARLLAITADLAADALAKDAAHAHDNGTEDPPGLGYLVALSAHAHRHAGG